jgi:hypothetical protein
MRCVVALLVIAGAAWADDGPSITIEVGKTTERDVGIARGWFCDDASLVSADLITRANRNIWVVTGVKEGTTQCRVGTDTARVAYVFDVRVVPKRARTAPR